MDADLVIAGYGSILQITSELLPYLWPQRSAIGHVTSVGLLSPFSGSSSLSFCDGVCKDILIVDELNCKMWQSFYYLSVASPPLWRMFSRYGESGGVSHLVCFILHYKRVWKSRLHKNHLGYRQKMPKDTYSNRHSDTSILFLIYCNKHCVDW